MAIDPDAAARARAFVEARLEAKRRELSERVAEVLEEGFRLPDMSPEAIDDRLMQVFELLAVCEELGEAGSESD